MECDSEAPTMYGWECGNSRCSKCGIDKKLKILQCPSLQALTKKVKVTIWKDAPPRNGGRSQKEPCSLKMPYNTFLQFFCDQSVTALKHMVETEWANECMTNKAETFSADEIVVLTDFSATPNLEAIATDNSSESNHMILDIFVVLTNPRMAEVVHEDGPSVKIRTNDCTYWAIVGPTDGYGKKNDHVFHSAAFHHIIHYHTQKLKDEQGITAKAVTLFTDNCKGQYKSQYNMYETAAFFERHPGMLLDHCYAPVYEFKGTHDGFGKIVKAAIQRAEKEGVRFPRFFCVTRSNTSWKTRRLG